MWLRLEGPGTTTTRAWAVTNDVSRSATEPEAGGALVVAGADDDEVVCDHTVDQYRRGRVRRRQRRDFEIGM